MEAIEKGSRFIWNAICMRYLKNENKWQENDVKYEK